MQVSNTHVQFLYLKHYKATFCICFSFKIFFFQKAYNEWWMIYTGPGQKTVVNFCWWIKITGDFLLGIQYTWYTAESNHCYFLRKTSMWSIKIWRFFNCLYILLSCPKNYSNHHDLSRFFNVIHVICHEWTRHVHMYSNYNPQL